MNWRDRFSKFMYGRYGADQFSKFCLGLQLRCVLFRFLFQEDLVPFLVL